MHLSSLFLTSALLLSPVLPLEAQGRLPDPIAYSCYFCTEEEMEQVAIDQGAGEHYVYDAREEWDSYRGEGIFGYIVTFDGGTATATRFTPESWVREQYGNMLRRYSFADGTTVYSISNVRLIPPDSGHGRSPSYALWGHHTTVLNPLHPRARETLRRWISEKVDLAYLRADHEHGRMLQFWFQKNGKNPMILRLGMGANEYGSIDFYRDSSTGKWLYLGANVLGKQVEESASDFVGPSGKKRYEYYAQHDLKMAGARRMGLGNRARTA